MKKAIRRILRMPLDFFDAPRVGAFFLSDASDPSGDDVAPFAIRRDLRSNLWKRKNSAEKRDGCRNLSCSPIVNAIPVRFRSGIRWSDVAIGSTPPWQLVLFLSDDLQDLYMTTALADGTRIEEEVGARVLRLRTGTPGVPEFFSRLGV